MPKLPIDLTTAVIHGLDPTLFCQERLDFTPDPWHATPDRNFSLHQEIIRHKPPVLM
jgi:hypothetical protein